MSEENLLRELLQEIREIKYILTDIKERLASIKTSRIRNPEGINYI